MSKKGRTNWPEVAVGAGIVAISILTPIPDDIIGLPLGFGLIAHGFNYI